jgi:hypothetical protein
MASWCVHQARGRVVPKRSTRHSAFDSQHRGQSKTYLVLQRREAECTPPSNRARKTEYPVRRGSFRRQV